MLNKTQETNTYTKEAKLKAIVLSNLHYCFKEINFRKLIHANQFRENYSPYSTKYIGTLINFTYKFCVSSSNNLSGDQDDVTMVEEETLEADTQEMILIATLQLI